MAKTKPIRGGPCRRRPPETVKRSAHPKPVKVKGIRQRLVTFEDEKQYVDHWHDECDCSKPSPLLAVCERVYKHHALVKLTKYYNALAECQSTKPPSTKHPSTKPPAYTNLEEAIDVITQSLLLLSETHPTVKQYVTKRQTILNQAFIRLRSFGVDKTGHFFKERHSTLLYRRTSTPRSSFRRRQLLISALFCNFY